MFKWIKTVVHLPVHIAQTLSRQFTERFIKTESASAQFLLFMTVIAFLLANSRYSEFYLDILHRELFGLSLHAWINDGLMTLFFFLVGLEIKKELRVGDLSSFKSALFPLIAALGGMIVPAAIFYLINYDSENSRAWGIPMATDIAFALAVLGFFSKRVPYSLKVILLALAIMDDLGAILVIAIFYSKNIQWIYFLAIAGVIAMILALNYLKVISYSIYFILGLVLWYCFLQSGVHATLSGVIMGLLTPLVVYSPLTQTDFSPLERSVSRLHPWVSFLIMPLFALVNAGVDLRSVKMSDLLPNAIFQGVSLGLIIGKPLGVVLFSVIALKFKWIQFPNHFRFKHLSILGILAGIGFTMSLFISHLAVSESMEIYSKAAILSASIISAFLAILVIKFT